MTEKYYCEDYDEYALNTENNPYRIYDLSKSNKTKEDFYDNEKECYDIPAFKEYLFENECMLTGDEVKDKLTKQEEKIKQLEKELLEINKHLYDNEFEFTVTENRVELFKDELYIKDTHTRVEMIKGRMLKITVYPPRHAPINLCYHITGKTFFHNAKKKY